MKFTDINEEGKVITALWIAESALHKIDEKEPYHHFCRETLDLCWQWFMDGNVDKEDIYGRISCDEENLLDIVISTDKEDTSLSDRYDMILVSVTYVDWQAFNYDEDEPGYPEELEEMSDEGFERVISIWGDKMLMEQSRYEDLLCYLKENCHIENKLAARKKIMEMVKNE